jgi:hypothetical protein
MPTTYPATKQTIPNPTGTDLQDNANNLLDHDYQHSTENDTVEALQDKVGIDNDPNVNSFDYKLSDIASGEKAISNNGSGQTLADITLTDPQINFGGDATGDMYYRSAGGITTRLPIGTSGQILQSNASSIPEWIANPSASTATYGVSGISTIDADVRFYAADAQASDTYVITLSPAPTAYVTGQTFRFKANTVNTGAATINVNSLGAKTIVKGVNTTLANGDIAAGQVVTITYDGTNFVLQNPTATASTNPYLGLYTNGTTTKNIADADATQTIAHGLGVIPKRIKLSALAPAVGGSGDVPAMAIFVYNGTTASGIATGYDNGTFRTSNGTTFVIYSAVTNTFNTGTVTFDATNISIAWVKTGSPTGTTNILWEADA